MTAINYYYVNEYFYDKNYRLMLKYFFQTISYLILVVVFSISLYRLFKTIHQSGLANIDIKMLVLHLFILIAMLFVSTVCLLATSELTKELH